MSSIRHYRLEIDGLRALAVMPVVFFHAGVNGFEGGYIGVDVFFVISGYLITGIIHRERLEGRFSLRSFYERRARRILPALQLVMLCCIPVAWFIMAPGLLEEFSRSLVAVVSYLSNFHFWWSRDYFSESAELVPLLHTWSLGVEEQFYLFFPLLMLAVGAVRKSRLLLVFSLLALASLLLSAYLSERYISFSFYLLPTRAWELLAGSLLAVALADGRAAVLPGARVWRELLASLGFLLLVYAMVVIDSATLFPGLAALIPVGGTLLLIGYATPDTLIGRLLAFRGLVLIGLLSYSLYLWHQPVLAFYRIYTGESPRGLMLILLLAVIAAIAFMSWRWVEAPCRDRHRVPTRTFLLGVLLTTAAVLVFGLTGSSRQGFASRYDSAVVQLAATADVSPLRAACHTSGLYYLPPAQACEYGEGTMEWAVLGDSHGVELAYALSERLSDRGQSLKHLTFSACGPVLSYRINLPGCTSWLQEALSELERNQAIRNVVVVYNHVTHERMPRLVEERGNELLRREQYYDDFEQVLQRLVSAGKQVFVTLPIPRLTADVRVGLYPRHILQKAAPSSAVENLQKTLEAHREDSRATRRSLQHLADALPVTVIDPAVALCQNGQCLAVDEGRLLYIDEHHVSVYGARKIVELFHETE
ncbi:MAG: acyltransferase family protein [Pseudomonadota bacterium]